MEKPPTWLLEHKRDVYSQAGEDGVIEEILTRIPGLDRWCVEFGAWDGLYLTNTRYLIESKDYSAILIEANKAKFNALTKNYEHNDKVVAVNQFVGFEQDDSLDQILADTSIPRDFDFLSIDIDGNDYHVWKAVHHYNPKVVIVEFNPTIPTEVDFVQPADPAIQQGSSLSSLTALGNDKGYELVSVLSFNAIFVRREYYPLFQIEDNSPQVLRTDLTAITYLFAGFDGHIFLRGSRRLHWHRMDLKESRFQQLPKFLRNYPGNFSAWQRKLFGFYRLIANPDRLRQAVKRLINNLRG